MMVVRWVVWSLAIVALGACGAAVPSGPATSATPGPSASASGSSVVTTSPTGSSAAERCHGDASVMYHDAPALEATLPTQVAGRDLATWSVADRCWLEILIDDDARIEEVLANGGDPAAIDVSRIAMAVAGQSDTKTDPPYFVYAVNRPQAQAEIELSLGLLMGGTGFRDLDTATRLDTYEPGQRGRQGGLRRHGGHAPSVGAPARQAVPLPDRRHHVPGDHG